MIVKHFDAVQRQGTTQMDGQDCNGAWCSIKNDSFHGTLVTGALQILFRGMKRNGPSGQSKTDPVHSYHRYDMMRLRHAPTHGAPVCRSRLISQLDPEATFHWASWRSNPFQKLDRRLWHSVDTGSRSTTHPWSERLGWIIWRLVPFWRYVSIERHYLDIVYSDLICIWEPWRRYSDTLERDHTGKVPRLTTLQILHPADQNRAVEGGPCTRTRVCSTFIKKLTIFIDVSMRKRRIFDREKLIKVRASLTIQPHCSNMMVLKPCQGYRGTPANGSESSPLFIVFSACVLWS